MTWEPPAFEEIKMDAELTAYCEDVVAVEIAPPRPGDSSAACASES